MEEKEVKNEVPAPETEKGKEPEKQGKEKKELTPQQIQQRKKLLVYPLMGLVFLGSMYLILHPPTRTKQRWKAWADLTPIFHNPKGTG